MPAPPNRQKLPRRGNLADHPFAEVVLTLWREAFTGVLDLTRERLSKRVMWREGVPVFAESNRPAERLCQQLIGRDHIKESHQQRVDDHMEVNEVGEGAALLALDLLDPKELVVELREQLRRRLVDCFSWPAGRFTLSDGAVPGDDAGALRVDPLQILLDGLATHWSPDRILQTLAPEFERYPVRGARFEALSARLRPEPEVQDLIATLDAACTFGEAVHRAPGIRALAAAWLLAQTGALDFADAPPRDAGDAQAGSDIRDEMALDIEIEVASTSVGSDPACAEDAGGAAADEPSPEVEALRKEVLERHERLDELDLYEVLGVAADAADGEIKRAYFALAKQFHPDALTRAGLSSLHREANELFARIAQAYQTLSNPARRQSYDRSKDGDAPSADANRVAQAETLFRKGEVLIKVGNFAGALDFLRPCVELWPEEADYQAALGWALYKKKPSEPESAKEHLEHALELKPDVPVVLFRLGMVMRRLGDEEGGQEFLDRSKAIEKEAKG